VVADLREGFVRGENALRTRLPDVKFEYNEGLRIPEVIDASGKRWTEDVVPVPANTGNVKCVAVGDIDGDRRADLVVSCENAKGDRVGVYWLRADDRSPASSWRAFNISGAPGIKFDLVRLLDFDGDGDLDVLTNEEQEGGRGLGVMWYENPRGQK
jgi:hypothetical protein